MPGQWIQDRGDKTQVVLTYEVAEKAWNDGVVLKQWFNIGNTTTGVSPHTKYGKACEIALERPIEVGEDLDPSRVFVGKTFLVYVGYRSIWSDGSFDQRNIKDRKDDKDFLRVHQIIRIISDQEINQAAHMKPYDPHMNPYSPTNTNDGAGGGGSGDKSISTDTSNKNTGTNMKE